MATTKIAMSAVVPKGPTKGPNICETDSKKFILAGLISTATGLVTST